MEKSNKNTQQQQAPEAATTAQPAQAQPVVTAEENATMQKVVAGAKQVGIFGAKIGTALAIGYAYQSGRNAANARAAKKALPPTL